MKSFGSRWFTLLLLVFGTVVGTLSARAISVTLAWDPSLDPTVGDYHVYYGPSGGTVTNEVATGGSTSATLTGLTAGASYFVYVTALNGNGMESPPSNSLIYTAQSAASAPQLAPVPNQTAVAASLLAVQLSATDSTVPAPVLTYSVLSGPGGARVDPTSGMFTWTPTAAQGPSTNSVTVQVSDNNSPPLTSSQTFTVVVTPANTPPVLAPIPNQWVSVGATLSVPLSATDSDQPPQTLTYILVTGPLGASVNSTTGVFTWTPTQSQLNSTNTVTVRVTDNGVPPLSASQRFLVVVTTPNTPPVLSPIPNLIATAGTPLTWQLSATDSDLPPQSLTYSINTGPAGASVTPGGLLSWTPTSAQVGQSFSAKVQVTDNGTPPLSASQSFTILVTAPITPPVLAPVANQSAFPGQQLVVQLSATDSSIPAQSLTYSVPSGPTGAAVNSTSGLFTWTPTTAQAPSTNLVTVKVADGQSPPMTASQSFSIVVRAANTPPVLAAVSNQTAVAGTPLVVRLRATDPDIPAQTLTYSIGSGPLGSSINAATGLFTWTPTQAQAPSTNLVTVQVTDNGTPPLSSSQSFSIVTVQANVPPVFSPVPDQTVSPGQVLMLALKAMDSNIPAQTLTYQMLAGPSTAKVSPSTGIFTWRLPKTVSASIYRVSVAATDNGSPPLSATQTFNIFVTTKSGSTVKPANLEVTSWVAELDSNQSVRFTWPLPADSQAGNAAYYLEVSEDLVTWTRLGAASAQSEIQDTGAIGKPHRFYRVVSEATNSALAPNQARASSTK